MLWRARRNTIRLMNSRIAIHSATRRLTVAADLHYADLRQATHVDQPEVIAPDVDDFREQYRNTFRYHLGAEYRHVVTGLAFRTGYYRDPIRYVGGGSLPEVQVKEDRDVLMFGLGSRLVKIVYLDLAVAVGGYRQMAGNREDHVRTVRAFASVGYRF